MADKWWLLLLRGIAAIVFGILAFIWPVITLLTLTLLWGAFALVDGIFALWGAIAGPGGQTGSAYGSLSSALPDPRRPAGICLARHHRPGALGVHRRVGNHHWRDADLGRDPVAQGDRGEWLPILSGLLSVAFGVLLLVQPGAGALAVVWIIGWYAILAGCIYIALAFRLKKLKHPA